MGSRSMTPSDEPSSPIDSGVRKRVCKACDRCRLKKSKCDGSSPCSRCRADNAICVFGERKKPHDKVYPKGYVEMLEAQQAQLVSGLQELYRRLHSGEGWAGPPLKETSRGKPLTHDILERLGALNHGDHAATERFEEELEGLCLKGWQEDGGIARKMSFDAGSDASYLPVCEPVQYNQRIQPHFSDSWFHNGFPHQLPPTPPSIEGTPSSPPRETESPLRTETTMPTSWPVRQQQYSWQVSTPELFDNMEFDDQMQIYQTTTGMGIAPSLTIKPGFSMHDELMRYAGF